MKHIFVRWVIFLLTKSTLKYESIFCQLNRPNDHDAYKNVLVKNCIDKKKNPFMFIW